MKTFLSALSLLLPLFLPACDQVRAGKIVEKIYHKSWTSVQFHVVSTGKTTISIPYTVTHPEFYELRIEALVEGKPKIGLVTVPADEYNRVRVGEMYGVETEPPKDS